MGITLAQFWDECNKHDWYYAFSDDDSVFRRGSANYGRLSRLAQESGPEYMAMLKAFGDHYFSGKPWNKEQQPKPERPIE